jgi:anti-anti-sigma factor
MVTITPMAPGASPIGLRIRWEDDACVLQLAGELDISTRDLLRDALAAIVDTECVVVVDLVEVSFADCAGITPVLEAAAVAGPRGRAVRLRNVPQSVRMMASRIPSLADVLS